jgi:hypothetical protein
MIFSPVVSLLVVASFKASVSFEACACLRARAAALAAMSCLKARQSLMMAMPPGAIVSRVA